jgi:hypothetical protein
MSDRCARKPLDLVGRLRAVVEDVLQVAAHRGVEPVAVALDEASQHAVQRLDGPLELLHLERELVDPARGADVAAEDLGFDPFDVLPKARHHEAVVVHHPVHDGV